MSKQLLATAALIILGTSHINADSVVRANGNMDSAQFAQLALTESKTSNSLSTSSFGDITPNRIEDIPQPKTIETKKLWMTAYSSSPDETDFDPFYTASGKHVKDGFVATNLLPFGTEVRIPSLFGNKIFIVEDRMANWPKAKLDIWMPSKERALVFGIRYAEIEILQPEVAMAK